jgi:hypothetical protein
MGHYCKICGRKRPNEQFSGRGHRIHVCKRCNAKPKSEQQAVEDKDDIFGFMNQSRISERNVARLEQMTKSENPKVASLAAIVLVKKAEKGVTEIEVNVASVTPFRPVPCPGRSQKDYGRVAVATGWEKAKRQTLDGASPRLY